MAASHNLPTNTQNHIMVSRPADLQTLPTQRATKDPNKQVIIPDLHGNVLRLIEQLYAQNVLEITQEDYKLLVAIYSSSEPLTTTQKKQFDHIINNKIQVDPCAVRKVLFLGDDTADRGKNDYFMLKVFNLLGKGNVNYEILLSNHGAEFLKFITYLEKNPLPPYSKYLSDIWCHPATSLVGLINSLDSDEGIIQRSEVLSLFKDGYLPAATLLGVSAGREEDVSPSITVYSHARVGFETIYALAKYFNIPCKIETAYDKCKIIEEINQAYRTNFHNAIQSYAKHLLKCPDIDGSIAANLYPLVRLAWNRPNNNDTVIEEKNDRFFHGHVGPKAAIENFPQHTNLDTSMLGRFHPDGMYNTGEAVVVTSDNYEGLIYILIKELEMYAPSLEKESKNVVDDGIAKTADRIRRYLLRESFSIDFPEKAEYTLAEEERFVQHPLFTRINNILERTKMEIPEAICPIYRLALPLRIKRLETQIADEKGKFTSLDAEVKILKAQKTDEESKLTSAKIEIERNKSEILRLKQELHNQKFTNKVRRSLSRNGFAIAGVLLGGALTVGILLLTGIAIIPATIIAMSITYAVCGGALGHALDDYRNERANIAAAPPPTTPAATDPQPSSSGIGHSGISAGLGITPQNQPNVVSSNSTPLPPSAPSSEQVHVNGKEDENKPLPTKMKMK